MKEKGRVGDLCFFWAFPLSCVSFGNTQKKKKTENCFTPSLIYYYPNVLECFPCLHAPDALAFVCLA